MKRDFTKENYEYFCEIVNSVKESDWCGITDWFGDRYYDVKHWFGDLGLINHMEDLEQYHREVIDKENTSIKKIRAVFEKVSEIDKRYGGEGEYSFEKCLEVLQKYRVMMQTLSRISCGTQEVVANGGKVGDYFNSRNIGLILGGVSHDLKFTLHEIVFTADTFKYLSDEYKDEVVLAYEYSHPEEAKHMNDVLSDPDFTDREKNDIKFLIYNAPEPYKTIYLEHIEKYKVDLYTPNGDRSGSYYSPSNGVISLTDSDNTLSNNPRAPYNTFFHESGHAIDDYEKGRGDMTGSFKYDGKTLNECVTEDVRNYVESYMESKYPNLTATQKKEIMRSLNLTDDASYNYEGTSGGLDARAKMIRQQIVEYMSDDLIGETNCAAADVYGGITNNAISGSYGHWSDTYWYRNGKSTGAQESELWAEFFAAKMTNDVAALESIKKHFPTAYKAMEAMANKMVEN